MTARAAGNAGTLECLLLFLAASVKNGRPRAKRLNEAEAGTTNGGNFRLDVNVNGAINSSDVSQIKAKAGTALPSVTDQSVSP